MDERDQNIDKRLEECQNYHYSQSSKVSALSRNIIYGMIGTCWVLIYSNNTFHKPCVGLIITLCLCFAYLLIDLRHYYSDSRSYRNEYFVLDANRTNENILNTHEDKMRQVSKRSYRWLKRKYNATLIIAGVFVISVLRQLGVF